MSTRTRLTRLERASAVRDGADLTRHWERQNARRLADLEAFLSAVPKSHEARVAGLLPRIGERLFVAGPGWARDDDPAFVRWAVMRAAWGRDHLFNTPLPNPSPSRCWTCSSTTPGPR